jgi:hypothetical protein
MRRLATAFLGLAVLATSASARAQAKEFGNRGTLSIGADRLFGFYFARQDIEYDYLPARPESHFDSTEIGLLWEGAHRLTPYTVPRAAVDYFVIDHLSIGGTIAFSSTSIDYDYPPDAYNRDQSGFLFGPRVGFGTMFNGWAGIWPRGGFTYYSFNGDGSLDCDQLAFTAEVMFVLQPAEGVAILIGPTLDYGLTGGIDVVSQPRADLHQHAFGFLTVGLLGWF